MRRVAALIILSLLLVACSGGTAPPRGPAGVSGEIQQIQGAQVLVRGELAPGAANPRLVMLTVTPRTVIVRRAGKDLTAITGADLKLGDKVDVWFEGPVRESYPEQADALYLRVNE